MRILEQCGAKKCTALAAFRQKAPEGGAMILTSEGGGGGQRLGEPCFFVLQGGGSDKGREATDT